MQGPVGPIRARSSQKNDSLEAFKPGHVTLVDGRFALLAVRGHRRSSRFSIVEDFLDEYQTGCAVLVITAVWIGIPMMHSPHVAIEVDPPLY